MRQRPATIVVELRSESADDSATVRELRRLLKTLLRRWRLRCVSLREVEG